MKGLLFVLGFSLCTLRLAAGVELPGDHFSPGWKRSGQVRSFKQVDLFNHIDGGAELFIEFGFEELWVQEYQQGKDKIALELYCMENPTAALGIYLFKCGKETPVAGVAARSSGDPFQFTVVKDRYFFQVNNFSGDKELLPVMKMLAVNVLKQIPEDPRVKLLQILPSRHLVPGSELVIRGPYALQKIYTFGEGDILLLQGKIFAAAADYIGYTLILIPYPDRKTAGAAFQNLISNLDPYLNIISRREKGFIFKDFQDKYGLVQVQGHLVQIKVHLLKEPGL